MLNNIKDILEKCSDKVEEEDGTLFRVHQQYVLVVSGFTFTEVKLRNDGKYEFVNNDEKLYCSSHRDVDVDLYELNPIGFTSLPSKDVV